MTSNSSSKKQSQDQNHSSDTAASAEPVNDMNAQPPNPVGPHTPPPPPSTAKSSTYAMSGNDLSSDPWSNDSDEWPQAPAAESSTETDAPPTPRPKSTFLDPTDPMALTSPMAASSNDLPYDDDPEHLSQQTSAMPSSRSFNGKMQGNQKAKFEYAQEDINALRTALKDNNVFHLAFYFLDYILRAQTALFEQIYRQQQLPRIIASMSLLCAILSAIYGLTMGMDHSLLQSVAAAIKLPFLFVLTAVICIPSLYTFNVLLGQRFKFLQTVTLMVMTLGTTSILLASLAPISFFFSMTTPEYSFLLLLHVAIFGLCGIYGVQYLYRGCTYLAFRMEQPLNNLLLRIWIVIYGLVGMQLGWRLRPFVGSDGSPFQIFRSEQGGNFYIAVWNAISSLFGGG